MEVAFFWVFQQNFRLFDKFRKEIVNSFKYAFLTTFWVQKSFFGIYLDPSSARKSWNFEWGTRILKNYGNIKNFGSKEGMGGGAKIHTWGCGAISPNRNTKHCKGPIFVFVNEIYITDKGDMLKWHCFLKEHSDH